MDRSDSLLIFDLKIEIRRIEVVNTNETVLTTGAVALAVRMKRHIVDGTEMVTNAGKLLLEDQVEEARLELARLGVQGSVDGFLTTTK